MVNGLCGLVFLSGLYPLWRAGRANRESSLFHAFLWAVGAWTVRGLALAAEFGTPERAFFLRYLALCLTGCAAVAVLGARRPGVVAWNFVVLGLLAVLLLPLAEGLLTGGRGQLDGVRAVFLAGTVAVGVLNY